MTHGSLSLAELCGASYRLPTYSSSSSFPLFLSFSYSTLQPPSLAFVPLFWAIATCLFFCLFSLSFELKTRCDAACPTDIVYLCQRLAHTFSSVLRIPSLYFVVVVCMCAIRYLTVERDKKQTNKQPLADIVCNIR